MRGDGAGPDCRDLSGSLPELVKRRTSGPALGPVAPVGSGPPIRCAGREGTSGHDGAGERVIARSRRERSSRWVGWVGARSWRVALFGVLVLVLASCGNDNDQNALTPKGKYARKADHLWNLVFPIAVVMFFLVALAVLFIIIRFRERPGNMDPKQVHGNTPLEIGWTIAPALLLAILAVPSVKTIFDIAKNPKDSVPVRVVGHQFYWEYQYLDQDPNDHPDAKVLFSTANELVIPTGRDVELFVTSVDVIHSFWIPELAGKQDAVPGRSVRLLMEADDPGMYRGQCAEFCGLSHANMRAEAIAKTPADFQTWVSEQEQVPRAAPTDPQAAAGAQLFTSAGCVACHQNKGYDPNGTQIGPNLTHVRSRDVYAGSIFDFAWGTPEGKAQLEQWIHNAPHEKPGVVMKNFSVGSTALSQEQLDALVAYLGTLK
jgi:cytochrome c oxidase subunit 2